jgi:hypothetical protein
VPELGLLGSVRGALSNERPYRECGNTGGWKMAVKLGPLSPFPAKNPL